MWPDSLGFKYRWIAGSLSPSHLEKSYECSSYHIGLLGGEINTAIKTLRQHWAWRRWSVGELSSLYSSELSEVEEEVGFWVGLWGTDKIGTSLQASFSLLKMTDFESFFRFRCPIFKNFTQRNGSMGDHFSLLNLKFLLFSLYLSLPFSIIFCLPG